MKMTNCFNAAAILLSSLMLLALPSRAAAQDAAQAVAQSGTTDGFDIMIVDGLLIQDEGNVDATLENVIDALRAKHPEANIVIAPDVPSMQIRNLKLRATDLRMELAALRAASRDQFVWETGPVQFDPVSGSRLDTSDQQLFIVRPAPEGPGRLRIEAFSLAGYFASMLKTDDPDKNADLISEQLAVINQMVDETVKVYALMNEDVYGRGADREKSSLSVRFHPGANLLILIGDAQSVEIASKVIGALPHVQRSDGAQGLPFAGSSGFTNPGMAGRGPAWYGDEAGGRAGAGAYGGFERAPASTQPERR